MIVNLPELIKWGWLLGLFAFLIMLVPPSDPPGSAPVRLADVSPSGYSAPLSAHFRGDLDPLHPQEPDTPGASPHFAEELGDWAWSEWVQEQGVGD